MNIFVCRVQYLAQVIAVLTFNRPFYANFRHIARNVDSIPNAVVSGDTVLKLYMFLFMHMYVIFFCTVNPKS